MPDRELADFPVATFDKVRYADTDRQGHVNNANFSTFLETGRVEFLYDPVEPMFDDGSSFVIASLTLNFLAEARWPGRIDIGTGVSRIGNASFSLHQGLFQDGRRVAVADTVIVHVDNATGRSKPLPDRTRSRLAAIALTDPPA